VSINWKHLGGYAAVALLSYGAGSIDGKAPVGAPKPVLGGLRDAQQAGTEVVSIGSDGLQEVSGEVGGLASTAGNGLEGAGSSVQDSTAAPAAPK
jgi:hypothetical protein